MPKYQLNWKAELSNITDLRIKNIDEFEWNFKLMCTNCHENNDTVVTLKASDEVEQHNSRGVANLVMKCKFCKKEGTLDIEKPTLKSYHVESNGKFQPLVVIEGRGWEPVEWILKNGFAAEGEESGTAFDDIALDEDWVEYDEKQGESVEIMNIEYNVTKAKGK
ncbi:hypothetical protein HDV06_006457 [Boothiomyces sp. JEL0866]|nr:hypothetical protein HDV06_001238 [Boothiomyces sp. JEL0866]KAJ3324564.1 hypothetical protein HDV06_006457 [Boothiomyces sp. JEL0866]